MNEEQTSSPDPKPRIGAPIGNTFALVHGFYSRAAIEERKRIRREHDAKRGMKPAGTAS